MRRERRKISWSRVFLLLAIVSALSIAMAAGAFYVWNSYTGTAKVVRDSQGTALPADKLNKRINVLLLGVDDGDEESKSRRSDTMIVVSINPDDGAVNLLSIPRDTKENIPGREREKEKKGLIRVAILKK